MPALPPPRDEIGAKTPADPRSPNVPLDRAFQDKFDRWRESLWKYREQRQRVANAAEVVAEAVCGFDLSALGCDLIIAALEKYEKEKRRLKEMQR